MKECGRHESSAVASRARPSQCSRASRGSDGPPPEREKEAHVSWRSAHGSARGQWQQPEESGDEKRRLLLQGRGVRLDETAV